jgi:hypothetical protein
MLSEFTPHRFQSDRALKVQLSRAVRQLAQANCGSYWDADKGRAVLIYRDQSPRAAKLIGDWLADAFGVAGKRFWAADEADAERVRREREGFHVGLDDVTAPLSDLEGNVQSASQTIVHGPA